MGQQKDRIVGEDDDDDDVDDDDDHSGDVDYDEEWGLDTQDDAIYMIKRPNFSSTNIFFDILISGCFTHLPLLFLAGFYNLRYRCLTRHVGNRKTAIDKQESVIFLFGKNTTPNSF